MNMRTIPSASVALESVAVRIESNPAVRHVTE